MWMLYAAGSALAAAAVALFAKVGLKEVDPTLATIIRGVVMAVLLVAAGFALKKFDGFNPLAVGGRTWAFIFLSAFAGAASWLLYFIALKSGPVSAVAVIDRMSVVVIILFAALFLGEAFTLKSVLGILLIMAGTLFIVFK